MCFPLTRVCNIHSHLFTFTADSSDLFSIGGLAYSAQGNYLCVFFGQAPAWPVDYFAQIEVGYEALNGGNWRDLSVSMEDPLAMESY